MGKKNGSNGVQIHETPGIIVTAVSTSIVIAVTILTAVTTLKIEITMSAMRVMIEASQ